MLTNWYCAYKYLATVVFPTPCGPEITQYLWFVYICPYKGYFKFGWILLWVSKK
jgi:hypothetical protein